MRYDELEWFEPSIPKPSLEEIMEKLEQLKHDEPMQKLRVERKHRLSASDWIVIRAYSMGVPVSSEWTTYMQALRDLPSVSTPTLDANGNLDMASVTWPIQPDA